ncbi:hypothetical protein HAX54_043666 [Datura stramonium]|uniref:Uncharacterized protein n=1 Tax=Datura stramonium TaxID=4076 RepID=A0ABS8SNP3_DATST|nr:hypothetical protein [Datura stramonium]
MESVGSLWWFVRLFRWECGGATAKEMREGPVARFGFAGWEKRGREEERLAAKRDGGWYLHGFRRCSRGVFAKGRRRRLVLFRHGRILVVFDFAGGGRSSGGQDLSVGGVRPVAGGLRVKEKKGVVVGFNGGDGGMRRFAGEAVEKGERGRHRWCFAGEDEGMVVG